MSLEQEFEEFKAIHKYSILKAVMMKYYSDLEEMREETNMPDFMREDTPEKLAEKSIKTLILGEDGINRFNYFYDLAWNKVAECLP